ncbi:uncharacterized protein EI90DRAFT_3079098, partial [Cantharellus anzutake]|uniref:uncharacterized protein n=1 Tax=Cantharellus anzutake TaxID=1750568 RepID=UPI0019083A0E
MVPPPFRRFVQQTIYQVSASAASLILALWYIHRLPIPCFRDDLLSSRNEIPWRILVLGLTLSNKWLEDNTFTTKTWHEVTGLSMASMRSLEMKALAIFSWVLGPQPDEWLAWISQLRRRELSTIHTIGSEREYRLANGAVKKPVQVLDELIAEVNGNDIEFDTFPAVTSCESPLLDDLDPSVGCFDASQQEIHPRLEMLWHTRTVETLNRDAGSCRPHTIHRDLFPRIPGIWDPTDTALDSPQPPRPRPSYEAVQRPPVAPIPPAPTCHQQYQHSG